MNAEDLAAVKLRHAGPTRVTRADGRVEEESKDGKNKRVLKDASGIAFVEGTPDPELACVIPGKLYLGSQDAMFNDQGMSDAGIVLVVHLAYLRRPKGLSESIEYLKVSVLDTDSQPLMPVLRRGGVFDAIERARGGVLVTCNAGVSRSASTVVAYLIERRGMGFPEAHELTRAARPQIRVTNFERELRELPIDKRVSGNVDVGR